MTRSRQNLFRIWEVAIIGAPLWWILGLNPFAYHFVSLLLIMGLLCSSRKRRRRFTVPPSAVFLLYIIVIYALSILIRALSDRGMSVFAEIYYWSYWVMAFILVVFMTNYFSKIRSRDVLRMFIYLSCVTGFFAMVMFCVWISGVPTVSFRSPLYGFSRFFGDSPLVEQFFWIQLLVKDKIALVDGSRLNVFSFHPAAAGGMICMSLMMAITSVRTRGTFKKPLFFFLLFVNLFALVMTWSAVSIFGFAVSFILVGMAWRKTSFLWVLFFIIPLIMAAPRIYLVVGQYLNRFQESRSFLPDGLLMGLTQFGGLDWLFGVGLKLRPVSLTSHSTYLSLLYRSGIVSVIIFFLFQVYLIVKWLQLRSIVFHQRDRLLFWEGLGWIIISIGLWMITQDIGAPQLLAFLYFSMIGVFEGFRRKCVIT